MAAPALSITNFTPYIAPVLMEATGLERGEALLQKMMREIDSAIVRNGSVRRRIVYQSDVEQFENLTTQIIVYSETRSPSWLQRGAIEDKQHHHIIVVVRDGSAALCVSDSSMRDRQVKKIKSARKIPRSVVAAFIGPEARSLWLNGVHQPTATKADSKALTGGALENALDPLGDHTYALSAARSHANIIGLADPTGKVALIGAAPAGSRVWLGRSQNWSDFISKIIAILDHATGTHANGNPFTQLARTIEDASSVADAYAVAVLPPDLLSEDTIDQERLELARKWAFAANYAVEARVGLALTVVPSLSGNSLGTLVLTPTIADGVVSLEGKWTEKNGGFDTDRKECMRFLTDTEIVKIYYDSGHTVAQGKCYESAYVDQDFKWQNANFTGYNLKQEKPVFSKGDPLAKKIAADEDNSLFAYVCQKMFLDDNGDPHGWLACDDGSMEIADFIHLDPSTKTISLIHVKGSKSDDPERTAAPSDFEIVVSQAVKNLRYLDRRNLYDELNKGKGKKIGTAVWNNGVRQADRKQFLKEAKKLGASYFKKLIVLQPRVTRQEIEKCKKNGVHHNRKQRLKQVDTLLLAASASALSCGTEFVAYCDASV